MSSRDMSRHREITRCIGLTRVAEKLRIPEATSERACSGTLSAHHRRQRTTPLFTHCVVVCGGVRDAMTKSSFFMNTTFPFGLLSRLAVWCSSLVRKSQRCRITRFCTQSPLVVKRRSQSPVTSARHSKHMSPISLPPSLPDVSHWHTSAANRP